MADEALPPKLEKDLALAEQAREKGEVEELFRLYKKAQYDVMAALRVVSTAIGMDKEWLRADPVEALERVAHDALAVARDKVRLLGRNGSTEDG